MRTLIRLGGCWAHTHFVVFVMSWLKSSQGIFSGSLRFQSLVWVNSTEEIPYQGNYNGRLLKIAIPCPCEFNERLLKISLFVWVNSVEDCGIFKHNFCKLYM